MRTSTQPGVGSLTTKTVLVVDGLAKVRFYHANLLREAGFQCIEVNDEQEAFEELRRQRVDLIMLDLIMPKMNGAEFSRRIRNMPQLAAIPLLVISPEIAESTVRLYAGGGQISFIINPSIPAILLESVRKLLA
jgi:two-component system chemotaxis response regulator CheY